MKLSRHGRSSGRVLAATLVGMLALGGCSTRGAEPTGAEIEDVVRRAIAAENAKDVKTFLTLWTDDGLSSYDVGSRQELESGAVDDFGSDPLRIVAFSDTTLDGSTARTTVDVTRVESELKPLFRAPQASARRMRRPA